MKPLTKILLLVALTALPLLAMTAPTQGAKRMEVAIQNEGVFLYNNYYNRTPRIGSCASSGPRTCG